MTSVSSHYLLYNTNKLSESDHAYDCIDFIDTNYNYRFELKSSGIIQITSYCIRPSYKTDNDQPLLENRQNIRRSFKIHTFEELRLELKVSAENLLLSPQFTSLTVIERYKIYLKTLDESMSKEKVYRCEGSWFGAECQYYLMSLTFPNMTNYGVKHPIPETFSEKYSSGALAVEMTCYTHLVCNRGLPPACLDWREICDGKIDCANDGIDEGFCDSGNLRFCSSDEFRCLDGRQCISKEFYHDDPLNPDCQDGSDEILLPKTELSAYPHICHRDVAFRCEERTCPPRTLACGDGQCAIYPDKCHSHRGELIMLEFVYVSKRKPVPSCSHIKPSCGTHIEDVKDCHTSCWSSRIRLCESRLGQLCASTIFTQSTSELKPEDHMSIFYDSKAIPASNAWIIVPHANCTNDTYCPKTQMYDDDPYRLWCQRFQKQMSLKYVGSYSRTSFTATINRLKKKCEIESANSADNDALSDQYEKIEKSVLDGQVPDKIHDRKKNNNELCSNSDPLNVCNQNKSIHAHENIIIGKTLNKKLKESIPYNWSSEFPIFKLCDGIQNLNPLVIAGVNQTDETECDHWSCNNIYTRCNGYINCPDGTDELNCTLLRCWDDEHLCVSLNTKRTKCLPQSSVLDSSIDCIGGTDEYKFCNRSHNLLYQSFLCSTYKCIDFKFVCDGVKDCVGGEDEYICNSFSSVIIQFLLYCGSTTISMYSHSKLSDCHGHSFFSPITFFSLFNLVSYPPLSKFIQQNKISHVNLDDEKPLSFNKNLMSNDIVKNLQGNTYLHCHRGLDVYVAIPFDRTLYERKCFCPPNYYGNRCQYQSDRVGLTLRMASFASKQTVFIFLITLIDEERHINSFFIRQYHPSVDCSAKFTHYLLYSLPMKDKKKNYSIHIDMYIQEDLSYHVSWHIPINYPHLPVTRIAAILKIPFERTLPTKTSHCNLQCQHGQCFKYINTDKYFCQCTHGWKGLLCDMKQRCNCAIDSLCAGSANRRSICICPVNKLGSRCLFDSICNKTICHNGGTCIAIDTPNFARYDKLYRCICKDEFDGVDCANRKIPISLMFTGIRTNPFMVIHTLSAFTIESRKHSVTFSKLSTNDNTATIYISTDLDGNLIFVQFDKLYYLVVVRESKTKSSNISAVVSPLRQCHDVRDLLNLTIAQFHPLIQMKYYPKLCREQTNLVCFHDERHMCLCTSDHFAGCFEFNVNSKFTCYNGNPCEKEGRCFEVHSQCSSIRECRCSECYYGSRCQFSTIGLGVSLDAILGYHIQPMKKLFRQSIPVKISAIITIVMFTLGLISSIMALITFRHSKSLEVGCGIYLLTTSVASLLTMIMFALKFWLFLLAQMSVIMHPVFLYVNCLSMDVLTTICLSTSNWLSACVATERTVNAIRGVKFNKKKSKKIATWFILVGIFCITLTYLPDPFHRVILNDDSERRKWCIVRYSSRVATYASANLLFHFIAPFAIDVIAAIIIIVKTARLNFIVQKHESYFKCFLKQFHHLKHHLISSGIIIIIYIPRLLLAFLPSCMKLTEDPWIYLAGYFVSFLPPVLIFPVFVLPSDLFRKEFCTQVNRLLNAMVRPCHHYRSTRHLTH